MKLYSFIGDLTNLLVVLGILFYNGLTLADSFGYVDLATNGYGPFVFGQHWRQDGFCISFKAEPLGGAVHTMLLCCYFSLPWAYLFHVMAQNTAHVPDVSQKMQAKISETLLHGIGHGLLWAFAGHIGKDSIYQGLALPVVICVVIFYFFFFFSFVNNATSSPWFASIVQCAFHSVALVLIPSQLNFTYVNCVFLLNAALWPLLESKLGKDNEAMILYALYALLVNVPILLTAWFEVLACDDFLFDWGGHVWFDASIPVSHFVYTLLVLYKYPPPPGNDKEKKKN